MSWMSDRRPSKPELGDLRVAQHKGWYDSTWTEHRRATLEDLIAVVRRGVESGTIKGEEVMWCESHDAEAYVEDYKAGVPVAHECWNSVYGWRLEDDCFIGARVLLGPVDEGDTQ